jgi:quinol-cytochrome oxidoreductase complex cytochrome b subunit
MATAFLGYILPWGQMSFWAATVITNFITSIPLLGADILYWVWGGFSINSATLNRFFCWHYVLPFVMAAAVLFHLIMLHNGGSTNELMVKASVTANEKFYPFFVLKDIFVLSICIFFFSVFIFFYTEMFNHSINYIKANPLVTPTHIMPEWYFMSYYAILRSVAHKDLGIVYMCVSFFMFYILVKFDGVKTIAHKNNVWYKVCFWFFVINFAFLGFIGSQPVTNIAVLVSMFLTCYYFIYFFIFQSFKT